MDEFKPTGVEIPPVKEFEISNEWTNQFNEIDFQKELLGYFSPSERIENNRIQGEYINEREFGLKECIESTKEIFTKDVIANWRYYSLEQREKIAQQYGETVANSLNIDNGHVFFKKLPELVGGYNNGDGNVYLNYNMLTNPGNVIKLIDTIAHETRHQFQHEAVLNPEKYGISPEVAKEWEFGLKNYTTCGSTMYDPWGYHYNPVEVDARYFGESVVRSLTKDIINQRQFNISDDSLNKKDVSSGPNYFINDRDWHIKEAEKALDRGDISNYNDHMSSAKISTK